MRKFIIINIIGMVLLSALSGCTSKVISANSPLVTNQEYSGTISQYFIGVDDTIKINVWKHAELSISVPVRPDGKISMPLIGDVKAAGLAPEVVAEKIRKNLVKFIRDPNVAVMVTGLQSHVYLTRLRITGAVRSPKSVTFRPGMTVLDVVLDAGGINDFASPNNTKLYRKIGGENRVINILLGDILADGELETNLKLRPGDIITVPERIF